MTMQFSYSPGKIVPRLKLGVTISPVLRTKKILAALSSWRMAWCNLNEVDDNDGGGLW
jgi:hypothetical protein